MPNLPSIVSFFGLRSPSKIEVSDDERSASTSSIDRKPVHKKQNAPKAVEDTPMAIESEDDDEDDDEVADDE